MRLKGTRMKIQSLLNWLRLLVAPMLGHIEPTDSILKECLGNPRFSSRLTYWKGIHPDWHTETLRSMNESHWGSNSSWSLSAYLVVTGLEKKMGKFPPDLHGRLAELIDTKSDVLGSDLMLKWLRVYIENFYREMREKEDQKNSIKNMFNSQFESL